MSRISLVSFPGLLALIALTSHASAAPTREHELPSAVLVVAPAASPTSQCVGLARPDAPRASDQLARRVSEALLGTAKFPSKRPVRKTQESKPAPAQERAEWRCGAWVELWQGSGRGRTCEWREPIE